jgi:hypothetical protein
VVFFKKKSEKWDFLKQVVFYIFLAVGGEPVTPWYAGIAAYIDPAIRPSPSPIRRRHYLRTSIPLP